MKYLICIFFMAIEMNSDCSEGGEFEDWSDQDSSDVKCLMCPSVFVSTKLVHQHQIESHAFDLVSFIVSHGS